jgi:hypothetical protein
MRAANEAKPNQLDVIAETIHGGKPGLLNLKFNSVENIVDVAIVEFPASYTPQ